MAAASPSLGWCASHVANTAHMATAASTNHETRGSLMEAESISRSEDLPFRTVPPASASPAIDLQAGRVPAGATMRRFLLGRIDLLESQPRGLMRPRDQEPRERW